MYSCVMTEQKRLKLLKASIRRNIYNLRTLNLSSEWREWKGYEPEASSNYAMELRFRRSIVSFGRSDYLKHFAKHERRS